MKKKTRQRKRERTYKPPVVISKAAVRRYALDYANRTHPGPGFITVSESFFNEINARTIRSIVLAVDSQDESNTKRSLK